MRRPHRCHGTNQPGASLVLVTLLAVTSCGLPAEERARVVPAGSVPYSLLEPDVASGASTSADGALPRRVPLVFWQRSDGKLTPSPVDASCEDSSLEVVKVVLRALAGSPTPRQRSAGWASAIPPSARLQLVSIDEGVARVDLDPEALGEPERLPLAVGQLVLSVTSAPGVDALQLTTSTEDVAVPLPSGALDARPVTADDYAQLLPQRLVDDQGSATVSVTVGCAASR